MKGIGISLALVSLGGLMIVGQCFAAGQGHQMGSSEVQGEQAQEQMQSQEQVQAQEQIHSSETQAQALNKEQIMEMQRLLKQQGYALSEVDGIMEQETVSAIRQFQNDEGLTETGEPNPETLRALAPDSDQQEFFGLSPEYEESEK